MVNRSRPESTACADPEGPGAFGCTLKELRLAAGFTQEELANRAGISSRAISDLERHGQRMPRLATVALLADALLLNGMDRARLAQAGRPAAARPVAAHAAPNDGRHPLPRPLTPLIGRVGLVTAVQGILARRETRLLTLTGPGGVGKTRLALEVGANLAGEFVDGIVFADLAVLRDPDLVMLAVADQLSIDDRDNTPVIEKLCAALRDRQLLLLLDNFEQVLPARTDLVRLLETCPQVLVVVTSRVALRVRAERECRVAPLEIPAAQEQIDDLRELPSTALFQERAISVGFELRAGDGPVIAEICRRLDGLPLAIELAAARIRLLPPTELLARLSARLPMLTGGPHDLPDRQRTMRNAIEWSYRLLSKPEQDLFRKLSVFVGGCALDAAESMAAEPSALEALSGLLEANLIQTEVSAPHVRYTMLETIREYGLELIAASDDGGFNAFEEHAGYFVEFTEVGKRLQPDEGNIRAALDWTIANAETALAFRLCRAMSGYWQERGQLGEGLQRYRASFALPAADLVPVGVRISALIGGAKLATDVSAFADAVVWSDQAVSLATAGGTTRDMLRALIVRGGLATEQARYADAANDLERAIAIADDEPHRAEFAEALIALSYVSLFTGESEQAEAFAARGLAIMRERGNVRALATALRSLAWQFVHSGNNQLSEQFGVESLQLSRSIDDTGGTAAALRQLGVTAGMRGDQQLALSRYSEALTLVQNRGDERQTYQLQAHLAHPLMMSGDFDRARELVLGSLSGARRFNDQWAAGMALTILGHIELADQRVELAQAMFVESSDLMLVIGNPMYLSWCLEGMAAVEVFRGAYRHAAVLCAARDAHLSRLESELPALNPTGHRETEAIVGRNLDFSEIALAAESANQRTIAELIADFRRPTGKAP